MNTLTVRRGAKTWKVSFHAPDALAKVLESGGIDIAKPCGGHGNCGKCKAEIRGFVSEPNERERAFGGRLICQAILLGDAAVTLPEEVKSKQIELGGRTAAKAVDPMPGKLGAAIDIGTTTLAVRICDLATGEPVGETGAENPQCGCAADVMGRISAALSGDARRLRGGVTECVSRMLARILSEAGRAGETVNSFVITGNTTMLYLLTGQDVTCLSRAPFQADRLFDEELPAFGGNAYLPPCIGAFVGADITCAVLSSGICRAGETNMLCDIGTNGEIALWKGGTLFVTSAAAGPAFEGAGISCGCGSIPGAIDRVWTENGRIRFHTIGDAAPVGLCGSGLLDALAAFLALGMIDESGAAQEELQIPASGVKLTQADVRAAQLAKAAIAAGIETLMKTSGTAAEEISELCIAGGFGGHIDLSGAVRIGLIPAALGGKARAIGNGALAGAEHLLLNRRRRAELRQLAKAAIPVNLGGDPDFNERFIDRLSFCSFVRPEQ